MPQVLTFDQESHVYTVGDRRLPHVTEIVDAGALWPFGKAAEDPGYYIERGRAVHAACQYDDQGILDEDTLDETIRPRLEAWRRFRRITGIEILANETSSYHRRLWYAGTLDRLIRWNHQVGILDIKCGDKDPAYGIQTAGYSMLVEQPEAQREDLGIDPIAPFLRRWTVHLPQTGRPHYEEHTDPEDREVFRYCLGIYRWKERNR